MENNNIFSLRRENLTELGGPMGTESTSTDFIKYFSKKIYAKQYAKKDLSKNHSKKDWQIVWFNNHNENSPNDCHSEDLGFCMYNVNEIKIEK